MSERKPYEPPRLTFLGTEPPPGFPDLVELAGDDLDDDELDDDDDFDDDEELDDDVDDEEITA